MGGPPQRQPEIDCKNKKVSCKNTGWVRLYAEFVCKGLGHTVDHKVLVKLRMLLREESMVFRLCMGQTASSLLGLVIDNEKQGIPQRRVTRAVSLLHPGIQEELVELEAFLLGNRSLGKNADSEFLSQRDFRDHLIPT